jgi:hypothetical protein
MSAVASFIKLPTASLKGLREAAIPKKKLFGRPRDYYHKFLASNGLAATRYNWSGYVLATLLVYLKKKRQIDLMSSEFDELAKFLTEKRGATHFIFSERNKKDCLPKFSEEFSEHELCVFYNNFNSSAETEAGKPMLDGVIALKQSLSQVDDQSVIVFSIA